MVTTEMLAVLENHKPWATELERLGAVGEAFEQLCDRCHHRPEWLSALMEGLEWGDVEPSDLRLLTVFAFPLGEDFFRQLAERNRQWRGEVAA